MQATYLGTSETFSFQEIEGKSEKEFYISGYISTKAIDKFNDTITEDCLNDMLVQIKSGSIKIDFEHETIHQENLDINPVARIVDARLDAKGLWVKAMVNSAHKRFTEIKGSIIRGFLDAFSIAFKPLETATRYIQGKAIRVLNKVKLINVGITGTPVNDECRLDKVMVKALSELDEDEEELDSEDVNEIALDDMSDEELEIKGHKYIKRTGTSGNYTYFYKDGSSSKKPKGESKESESEKEKPKGDKEKKKSYSFVDILNDEEGKKLVEGIEDVISSLDAYPDGEPELERIKSSLIKELKDKFGHEWQEDKPAKKKESASKEELLEASDKALDEWNNSKRNDAAIDRWNVTMSMIRNGINPYKKVEKKSLESPEETSQTIVPGIEDNNPVEVLSTSQSTEQSEDNRQTMEEQKPVEEVAKVEETKTETKEEVKTESVESVKEELAEVKAQLVKLQQQLAKPELKAIQEAMPTTKQKDNVTPLGLIG